MRGMESYSRAAMERAMKVQEVILRAVAKKITWWQAAEIIGISDRQIRRWRYRYEEFGFRGLFDRRGGQPCPEGGGVAAGQAVAEEGGDGGGGAGAGALSGEVFRSQRASLSRKTNVGAPDRAQLQLGERDAAGSRVDRPWTQARSASAAATAAAVAGHAVAH